MKSEAGLKWRVLKLFLSSPARLHGVIRFALLRSLGIPYHKRFGHSLSPLPSNVSIIPTLRCNLSCKMCAQSVVRKDESGRSWWYDPGLELSVEKWVSFLDQISASRPPLYMTGGEPLLYPHFRDLMREIKKRGLYVQLATNGTLLSREADFLVQEGVEGVTVSIDGPPEVHDRIRGIKGTFNRAAEGVSALVAARRRHKSPGPTLSFICTISKTNYEYLEETLEEAIRLNGDYLQLNHVRFYVPELVSKHNAFFTPERADAMGLKMSLPSIRDGLSENEMDEEDVQKLVKLVERVTKSAKRRIMLAFEPRLPADLIAPYYLDMDYPFLEKCDAFWGSINVGPNGRVSPCLNFEVGNITEQSVSELWNGEMMGRLRDLLAKGLFPGCHRCNRRSYHKSSRCFI